MEDFWDRNSHVILSIAGALLVLLAGWILALLLRRATLRLLKKREGTADASGLTRLHMLQRLTTVIIMVAARGDRSVHGGYPRGETLRRGDVRVRGYRRDRPGFCRSDHGRQPHLGHHDLVRAAASPGRPRGGGQRLRPGGGDRPLLHLHQDLGQPARDHPQPDPLQERDPQLHGERRAHAGGGQPPVRLRGGRHPSAFAPAGTGARPAVFRGGPGAHGPGGADRRHRHHRATGGLVRQPAGGLGFRRRAARGGIAPAGGRRDGAVLLSACC